MGNTFEADQLSKKLMSWKETCAMEQRLTFVKAIEQGDEFFAELCRAFGISRKTGYKWRKRYETGGAVALSDQSRAPHHQAHAMSEPIAKAILDARSDHRRWGPEKLRAWLRRKQPDQHWPSASTIGEMLKRAGLTAKPGKRLWVAPTPGRLQSAESANAVWCADFKGYFHCQDGSRCDPLTVTDAYSRYLLRCQAVDGLDEKYARALFEAAFREYGLPNTIRTDNGAPFASVALAAYRRYRCGGSSWASGRSESIPGNRSRTEGTSECIVRCESPPPRLPRQRWAVSNEPSMRFVRSTTMIVRTKPWQ
jgi:putative transposase